MTVARVTPIGLRLEPLRRNPDGTYSQVASDGWAEHQGDPARTLAPILAGHVHERVTLSGSSASALALVEPGSGGGDALLEIDDFGRPLGVSDTGVRAVRRLDAWFSGEEVDLEPVVEALMGEPPPLRTAVLQRAERSVDHVPPLLLRLAPWELLEASTRALVESLAGRPDCSAPLLRHYFRTAAPAMVSALASARRALERDGALGPGEADEIAAAAKALPVQWMPDSTRAAVEQLLGSLRELAHPPALDAAAEHVAAAAVTKRQPLRARARAHMAQAGATLREVLFPNVRLAPILDFGKDQEHRPPTRAAEPGSFGPVRLRATDPPGGVLMEIDFDRLPTMAGQATLIFVLRQDEDVPLAAVTVDPSTGLQRRRLDLDPTVLHDPAIRIGLGTIDA
jgi:hypothetical protein